MKRTPVESTLITAIGHDPETQVLEIQFKGHDGKPGPTYRYQNVTAEQHKALINARSIGGRFLATIRDNPAHPSTQVPEEKK